MSSKTPPPHTQNNAPDTNPSISELAFDILTNLKTQANTLFENVKEWIPNTTDSVVTNWVVTAFSVIVTLLLVVLFVALGWYIVWTCFLSRFKLIRELVLSNTPPESRTPPSPEQQPEQKRKTRRKRTHYD